MNINKKLLAFLLYQFIKFLDFHINPILIWFRGKMSWRWDRDIIRVFLTSNNPYCLIEAPIIKTISRVLGFPYHLELRYITKLYRINAETDIRQGIRSSVMQNYDF